MDWQAVVYRPAVFIVVCKTRYLEIVKRSCAKCCGKVAIRHISSYEAFPTILVPTTVLIIVTYWHIEISNLNVLKQE